MISTSTVRGGLIPLKLGRPQLVLSRSKAVRIACSSGGRSLLVTRDVPSADNNGNGTHLQPAALAAPVPVTVTGQVAVGAVLPPAAVYETASNLGAAKAAMPFWKIVLLGIVAGLYIGLCAALLMTVGPNCPSIASTNPGLAKYITGAIGFPFVLLMILTCGAELFTGNTALVTAAVYEGKATIPQLLKNWVGSYAGNCIGCAIGVLMLMNCGLMPQFTPAINAISTAKIAYPLKETFIKAVMANWFVCLAVWQATAAQTFGGKFIACLSGISAFVAIGLEHCVANMVFVPLGILTGVQGVTWSKFFMCNLIPVTLGNIVAGALCVATVYSLAYGSLGKRLSGA